MNYLSLRFLPYRKMVQQQQKSPGAVLFGDYENYNPAGLSEEEANQLVRYSFGIIHNIEKTNPGRLKKARRILIEQGHRAPNYLTPALNDKRHLDYIVNLLDEITKQNPDHDFIDAFARNLTGALANENQKEGALRVLGLEQVCGAALSYVAGILKDDNLYPVVSTFFKRAAEFEQHNQAVLGVLTWAMRQQELSINAAFMLNSLAGKYGWGIGTRVDATTDQPVGTSGLEAKLNNGL